ncbi:D-tyrosyl-tRNA(Tyr) deacylase [Moraxella caviae]|uniref:D-aminoacyl-tRNA deacylase n=1 Tax=Moraxella caviae TaxID=34060 RepID=A0A1T0A241_9GAMM|nr:D-aminoacyl-tRNA deacylase [Moraxella caviae]OOR89765.1 D-tyrosyl-tRNA(Tyr) deacylase [Moraxella caviae]STZ10706.1 D-tyrosyl-tRNA(Tyr) deacylase [Moraxella caviae]
MRALIQRVKSANVVVDGAVIGAIDNGVLAYIGIGKDDDVAHAKKLVDKILSYRIFENTTDADKLGKLDKSVQDVGGGLLLVSQFTLMAKTDKGRRPDFAPAMPPADAGRLFDELVNYAKTQHALVQTGEFGANMAVTAVNDGPINFLLEV